MIQALYHLLFALIVTKQSECTPLPLRFDFEVLKTVGNATANEFWTTNGPPNLKRDAFSEPLINIKDLSYQIEIFLGSNRQSNYVVLDTGSSDLWVPSSGYDPASSHTSQNTGEAFYNMYLDGTYVTGEYYLDTIQFDSGNLILSNFQFAMANASGVGVMGIADRNQETAQTKYNNFPWAMEAAGIISKAAYSIFLGPEGSSGTIIFGGIDTQKYCGELVQYPIDEQTGYLAIEVESVTFNGKQIGVNAPALLDSGVSLGLLNQELMSELDVLFNTTVVNIGGIGYRYVSCDQPEDKTLEFNFGKNSIVLTYTDAVVKQDDGSCMLGFAYFQGYQIYGDAFLRSAYVYYDLSGRTISLAQASHSGCSNIVST